jgi:prepilin signal peptidase PulO-like enzyme (type II secretory pathway)
VELCTGLLFTIFFNKVFFQISASNWLVIVTAVIYYFLIISCLIAIFFIDLENYIIPDSLLVIGNIGAGLYLLLAGVSAGGLASRGISAKIFDVIFPYIRKMLVGDSFFVNHIIFAIIGLAFFGLIILITKGKGMGVGDMKFAFLIGMVLGEKMLLAFYFSFIIGAIAGIYLIVTKRKKLKSEIPFGPFLVIATIISML